MNTNNLPPLPATELGLAFYDEGGMHEDEGAGYSEKQMREYGQLCRQPLLDTIEQQQETLVFVERWACHHGAKPYMTAEQALSCIQHYPPINAITKSYVDGVVPDTYDPYAVIEQQRKLLELALVALERSEPVRAANYDAHDAFETEITNHLRQQEGEKK